MYKVNILMKISVIGSGVIGLTTAIALQEAGHEVHIFTKNLPEEPRPPWRQRLDALSCGAAGRCKSLKKNELRYF